MGITETCVWIVISIVAFAICFGLGLFAGKEDREVGFLISLLLSSLAFGLCLTYILQMKGLL